MRSILHEQGREIDQLRLENMDHRKRINELEQCLEEEMKRRQGEYDSLTIKIETEVEERIFYDKRITTVVDGDRDANHQALYRLKEHMDRENEMLRRCLTDSMSIYFNASRDREYDRGGEEILKYDKVVINAGGGLNPNTGVFTCPVGGTYMFTIHLATHKDKVKTPYLRP